MGNGHQTAEEVKQIKQTAENKDDGNKGAENLNTIMQTYMQGLQSALGSINVPSVSVPDTQQTMRDTLSALFDYSPKFAEQAWEQLKQYSGQQAQLNNDLTAQYVPQELSTELSILSQFLPRFQSLAQSGEASDREATLENIQSLTPLINEIERASDPEAAKMRNLLRNTVMGELEAGSQLTDAQKRQTEQALRSAEVARGVAGGQGSANREAVASALAGRELLNQRIQNAGQFLESNQAAQADPFDIALSIPASSLSYGVNAVNSPYRTATTYGDPISGNSSALSGVSLGSSNAQASANNALQAGQLNSQYQMWAQNMAGNMANQSLNTLLSLTRLGDENAYNIFGISS